MMRKGLLFLAAFAAASPAVAANLVTNGGFEAGNTGFTSTYTYVAPGGSMVPENTYSVGPNASAYHGSWANVAAHSGTNYFIANGSPTDNASAWKQTLSGLTVGATYNFSAWAVNVCCNTSYTGPNASPLIISVGSGGTPATIATSGVLGSTGVWTLFTGSFVANSTSTDLSIFTDINDRGGNDYGLDDISVTAAVPEPATWAMMIAGFGLIGGLMRRRNNQGAVSFA